MDFYYSLAQIIGFHTLLGLVLGFGGVVLVVWEKLGLGELGAAGPTE